MCDLNTSGQRICRLLFKTWQIY